MLFEDIDPWSDPVVWESQQHCAKPHAEDCCDDLVGTGSGQNL